MREFGGSERELGEREVGARGFRLGEGRKRPAPPAVQIAKSSGFIRVSGPAKPALDTAVGLLADLAGHNIPVAVGVAAATEVAQRYSHMSQDEMAVFDLLRRLAQGGSIYKVWIEENDLLDAMDPDLELVERRRVLARMKSKDLLEEGAGWWRAAF